MAAFLVDTNVLVYAYDESNGRKRDRAIHILETLASLANGFLTTQVLGEFFVLATRKMAVPLSLEHAAGAVYGYIDSWTVINLTPAIVLEAIRGVQGHQLHYYDSLIWAAAKLHQIGHVLTEDGQHDRLIEGVRYLNPFHADFELPILTR